MHAGLERCFRLQGLSLGLCAGRVEGAVGGQGEEHECEAGTASAPHPRAQSWAAPLLLHYSRPGFWPGKFHLSPDPSPPALPPCCSTLIPVAWQQLRASSKRFECILKACSPFLEVTLSGHFVFLASMLLLSVEHPCCFGVHIAMPWQLPPPQMSLLGNVTNRKCQAPQDVGTLFACLAS